jgi:molybdate transport system substrate-binding protein
MTRAVSLLLLLGAISAHAREPSVLVFAAASTSDGVSAAARAFESRSDAKVETSFAGTNELLRQIKAGAPADLFLAADVASVDALPKTVQRMAYLSNELVVIVPVASKATTFSADWLKSLKHLSIADPAGVPAGKYAKGWLEKLGVFAELQSQLVPALDVRAALASVESGRAEAGIVYATDAARITYTLALLTESAQAKAFYAFLQSDEGRGEFLKRGFRPAK